MKNNKSAGPGGIPAELIKNAPVAVFEILANIFTKCLNGAEVPEEWKTACISSIFKKGDKKNWANYRGISVTATAGRLYGRILKNRIEKDDIEVEEQSGFRPGRSCTDNIFCLKQLMEKSLSHGSELHLVYIDLKKAYDSVPINKLWDALKEGGVEDIYINAVKRLYKDTTSFVKVGREQSKVFQVNKGLRQGCCISPTLFKIYLNAALRQWVRKCRPMGIKMGEENIYTLLFADDQVVLAEDEDDINYMVRKIIEEYTNWGLELNVEKTQYMVVGRNGEDLNIGTHSIKLTNEYKYLGVTLVSDGTDNTDILNKVNIGRSITRQLHPVLWQKSISNMTKTRMFKTLVESCALYGSETWTPSERMKGRLSAMEMSYWRRCCGRTLFDKVRNDTIRNQMMVKTTMTEDIQTKQLLWYGHMRRMPESRLPLRTWIWKPTRRRRRGRPRKTWDGEVTAAMKERGLEADDYLDRDTWRAGCDKWHKL